jgi:hypothetical protein
MSSTTSDACPNCGGLRLSWRVFRPSTTNAVGVHRDLEWSCKACGTAWRETVGLEMPPREGPVPARPA